MQFFLWFWRSNRIEAYIISQQRFETECNPVKHFEDGKYLHNHPDAYWCAGCHHFTLDCSHLVEPLKSPIMKLDHWQYLEATW